MGLVKRPLSAPACHVISSFRLHAAPRPSPTPTQWRVWRLQASRIPRRNLQHSSAPSSGDPGAFTYKVAAAFTGKKNNPFEADKQHYTYDSATGVGEYGHEAMRELLQLGKRIPSGQDSFFATSLGSTGAAAFAVADGVGGYGDQGIDSAEFAHGLCRYMQQHADAYTPPPSSKQLLRPQSLLQAGYNDVCHDAAILGGGSTACVGIATPSGTLHVANLGDSGFTHLRLNAVAHYSAPQTHAFNTPFQLSTVPPKVLAQIQRFGGTMPFHDMPSDASVSAHDLRHGDVLVFATDGVWDNLTSQEVLERVSGIMLAAGGWAAPAGKAVQVGKALPSLLEQPREGKGRVALHTALAIDIARQAKAAAMNPKRDGPFAKAVQQAYPNERWKGGKEDDICVVVVVAVDQSMV